MTEIITIFTCLNPLLSTKTYKQLLIDSQSMLAMTGQITMLSIIKDHYYIPMLLHFAKSDRQIVTSS